MLAWPIAVMLAAAPFGRYREVAWSTDEGLPQSSVTAIAQSRDGWLDIGTFGGFARYDGHAFEMVSAAEGDGWSTIRISAIAVDDDGRRYIGLQDGGIVVLEADGSEQVLPVAATLDGAAIWSLAPDGDVLWAAGQQGVARLERGTWTAIEGVEIGHAVLRHGDDVWIGHEPGLARVVDDRAVPVTTPIAPVFALEPNGAGLLVGGGGGVVERSGGRTRLLATEPARELAVAADGTIFAAFDSRLHIVGEAGSRELGATIRDLLVDREQGLWVGTDPGGLHRFVAEDWRLIDVGDGVLPMIELSDGALLVGYGCEPGGLVRIEADGDMVGIAGGCVRALARDDRGVLLGVGTQLARLEDEDRVVTVAELGHNVQVVTPKGRDVWIGTDSGGAFRVRDGHVTPVDVGDRRVLAIAVGVADDLWFGTHRGLSHLQGGVLERFTRDAGVPAGEIRALHVDRDGTVLMGSYGGGLGVWRAGKFHRITRADGLADDVVSAILDDDHGALWLHGNRGLTRVMRGDLERHLVDPEHHVAARRWATPEGNGGGQPAGVLTASGTLMLPTVDGVLALDPSQLVNNPVVPQVQIRHAVIDGVELTPGSTPEVPPGPGHLELAFTSPILRHPELAVFEYRVLSDGEEVAPGWRRADADRRASWVGFAPGRHTIELRAAAEQGEWSPTVAVAFELLPHWYERWWVRAGMFLAALAAVASVLAARARWLRRNVQRLQGEVERRAAVEQALRVSEAHHRRVFEAGSDALFVVGRDGRVQQANAAAQRLLGRDPVGRPFEPLFTAPRGLEGVRGIADSSSPRYVLLARMPFDDDRMLARAVDVTARVLGEERQRELSRRLERAERLEAVGRLAGGIAHDFNNLLTAVRGAAEALQSLDEHERSESNALVEMLQGCVDRGATLTRQLLSFARRQALEPDAIDTCALLRELQTMLSALLRDDVRLRLALGESPLGVHADPAQLELAIVNLVLNAQEAMPGGGEITIIVQACEHAEAARRWPDLPGGVACWTVIEVTDTGVGIPADRLEKVLEPFYTTRAAGTGLGLPSVLGFAEQSGGGLRLRSQVGVGTTVTMLLPNTQPRARSVEPVASTAVAPAPRRARVVVCDDDDLVRASLVTSLRRGGYEPIAFADPEAAARELESGLACEILVTDVVMPRLSGPELARRVLARRPGLRVLFVSGYLDQHDATSLPGRLLAKPLRTRELLDAVAAALTETWPQASGG
ncbi:MAG: response regulator [Deltaproteobacteria bacterium]|nr:response regulator [Deltaproteobacteria bacterium]